MKLAWVLVPACALAGCASSADPSQATLRSERIRSWEKLCDDRGFTRGTADFQDCVMGYDRAAANPPVR
jgi:hypothetical protein